MGESGCGKSTLGRGLLGLLPTGAVRDGELLFKGGDMLAMTPKQARALRGPEIGMIFQEPLTRLNPLMRISEHFEETVKAHEPGLSQGCRPRPAPWRCCVSWASRRPATVVPA